MLTEHSKIYYINSNDRISGTDSRFTISIPYYPQDNFNTVCVLQAVIPKSYYLIRPGLNTFTLQENFVNTTIIIPIGNYSRRSLESTVQNLLNANSPNSIGYTISWPSSTQPHTGKFTFTCTDIGGIQPIFIFDDNELSNRLGFQENSSNQFVGFQLQSTNVIDLQAQNIIYLHSDICNTDKDDILQEFYVSTGDADFSNIHYTVPDVEVYSKQLVSKTKQVYTFYLTDENSKEIHLNGINMGFSLLLYRKNNNDDIIKNYIQYKMLNEDKYINLN